MAMAASNKANGITADKPYEYGPKIQSKGSPRPEDEAAAFKFMAEARDANPEPVDDSDPAAEAASSKTETKDEKKNKAPKAAASNKSTKKPTTAETKDAADGEAKPSSDESAEPAKEAKSSEADKAEAEELATRMFTPEMMQPVRRHKVFGNHKRRSSLES